ncbi:MAG: hypothetical protein N2484_07315 [Clostridia bacterium]|nr:hypothetical protein [Clostridia bacterium]
MMSDNCLLYDRTCTDCGECDQCDLNRTKRCDNCGRCIDSNSEFLSLDVMKYLSEHQEQGTKKVNENPVKKKKNTET